MMGGYSTKYTLLFDMYMLFCCSHPILVLNTVYLLIMYTSIWDLSPDLHIQWPTQHLHLGIVLVIYLVTLSPKSVYESLLLDAGHGTLKTTFPRSPCDWLPVRFPQMECWETMEGRYSQSVGHLAPYALDPPFISAAVWWTVPCMLTMFYLKDLPLSFIFYASRLSLKPETPLAYVQMHHNFRWVNIPAENPQLVRLAVNIFWLSYGQFQEEFWILDTSRRNNTVPTA